MVELSSDVNISMTWYLLSRWCNHGAVTSISPRLKTLNTPQTPCLSPATNICQLIRISTKKRGTAPHFKAGFYMMEAQPSIACRTCCSEIADNAQDAAPTMHPAIQQPTNTCQWCIILVRPPRQRRE
ncbi:hypothetical protein X797_004222 [Metarhizium robertsii]|uniref:Uncharacterized protein n=1 Tax=Metarhizium robertsii TaxID=568076 RepID=A0A0A1UYV2_9HYPO|nr:hypothetical protein X797_004222 [Metarhizium robertsii]